MIRSAALSVLSLLCLLSICSLNYAEQWARFRGPNGCGVSGSEGLPAEIGPETNVVWKVETKKGSSSPVIVDGKLFLSSFDGDERIVHCLDTKTGRELWQKSVQKRRQENSNILNGPATPTPAIDGSNIVVFFPDTGLLCYSVTGELKWNTDVGPFYSMHGIAHSPVIVDDKVILLADQLKGSFAAAYNLKTGQQVWRVDRVDGLTGGFSSPTLFTTESGKSIVLTSGPAGLLGYDPASGETALSVAGVCNAPVTLPIVSGSRAFICEPVGEAMPMSALGPLDANQDGKMTLEEAKRSEAAYRLLEGVDSRWGNKDGVVESSEWDKAFGRFIGNGGLVAVNLAGVDGGTGDAKPDSRVQWTYEKSVPYIASPLVYQGLLYVIQDKGGILLAVEPETGEVVKKSRLKKAGRSYYASPVAADGKIFVVDVDGQLTVIRAGREWEELSTSALGERCYATPAIHDGRIYVRTASKLYCFGSEP